MFLSAEREEEIERGNVGEQESKRRRGRKGKRTLERHFREVNAIHSSRTITSSTQEGLRKKNEIERGRRRKGVTGRQCWHGKYVYCISIMAAATGNRLERK